MDEGEKKRVVRAFLSSSLPPSNLENHSVIQGVTDQVRRTIQNRREREWDAGLPFHTLTHTLSHTYTHTYTHTHTHTHPLSLLFPLTFSLSSSSSSLLSFLLSPFFLFLFLFICTLVSFHLTSMDLRLLSHSISLFLTTFTMWIPGSEGITTLAVAKTSFLAFFT